MLEWLCLVAVMAFVANRLQPRGVGKGRGESAARESAPRAPQQAAVRVVPRLTIAGTERPQLASARFVKGFGIEPSSLKDLSVYRGTTGRFPVAIAAILADLHAAGQAVGDAIMEVIHHHRPLAADEGVYFALVQAHENAEPRVVAFVDRVRTG